MRSNIVRTWAANSGEEGDSRSIVSAPAASVSAFITARLPPRGPAEPGSPTAALLQRGQEVRAVVELLLREVLEGGHDARTRLERAQDRVARDAGADVGQIRAGARVAVVSQLVAG